MSQDREFEKYLQGKSGLTQLYADLPEVELPDHLDAAILAEAHRAVGARPGAKPKRRWAIPLGMVATLFVAVMVGLQLPYMLKDAASPQQYKEEKIAALMDKGMTEGSSAAPEERKKVQEMPQVMPRAKSAISRGEISSMAAEAEVPARQNAPALAAPKESTVAKQFGATSVGASPPPAGAANRELRESAGAEPGMSFSNENPPSGLAEGNTREAIQPRAPAAATMAAPPPVQLKRSQVQPLKDEASDASLTPDDWLKRIKRLKQKGNLEEAKKELAEFKKRYPDYRVPQALEVR
jgi:hypothetical protein